MNEFVDETIRDLVEQQGNRIYPLSRGDELKADLRQLFSTHLGNLSHGGHFEAEGLLVTGQSGSGKTTELVNLIEKFNASGAKLPNGKQAKFASCLLKSVAGWKDLGYRTARSLHYPIESKSKLTQIEIWDIVVREAKLGGYVGIHFDEVQHIFRKKKDADQLAILDAFKTLMKSHDWPLILIFSGIPELDDYMRQEMQLYRLLKRFPFDDVVLPKDYETVHEIVGSYALEQNQVVDPDLMSQDFFDRLVTAGAYRWGLIIKLVETAVIQANRVGSGVLLREHFVQWWVTKTKAAPAVTPYLHREFETMYRKEHPFLEAIQS